MRPEPSDPAGGATVSQAGAGCRPLKLLVITSLWPTRERPDFGVFNARSLRLLAQLGVDVRVLVPRLWLPGPLRHLSRFPLADADVEQPPGVRLCLAWHLHPPGRAFATLEWRTKLPTARWTAARWHARDPFDVVLGIDMTADAILAVRLGQALGLPVATLAIGSDVMVRPQRHPALRRQLAETLSCVDLPLGVSKAACRALAATGACRREPLVMYRSRDRWPPATPGERQAHRRRLGIRADACVAIYVGHLTDAKGMPELAEAVRPLLLSRPSLQLLLVGAGPHEASWRALARGLQNPDRILLTGRLSPSDIRCQLVAADFMVFPSRSEGLPQSVIEAMDCGLPVIGTRVGGIPEAVIHGVTGLLVPARDAQALREAMARLIDEADLRARCAAAARIRAGTVFDPGRGVRRLRSALESIVRDAASPAAAREPLIRRGAIDGAADAFAVGPRPPDQGRR